MNDCGAKSAEYLFLKTLFTLIYVLKLSKLDPTNHVHICGIYVDTVDIVPSNYRCISIALYKL